MAVNLSTLGTRQIENALRRGAKTALVANGIEPSTRRGNKELTLAVQRLAQQTYSTIEEAIQTGEALGQKIVELSQAKGKTDLDGGIVRQMMLTGEIPTVVKVTAKPAKTTPVVVDTAPRAAETTTAKPAVAEAKAKVKQETAVEVPNTEAIAAPEAEEPDTSDADVVADDVMATEAAPEAEELDTSDADVVADDIMAAEAALEAEEPDTSDAGVGADDVIAAEDLETVDSEIADAPDLDAIETLDPAHIDAPDPEPLTAAETAGTAQ